MHDNDIRRPGELRVIREEELAARLRVRRWQLALAFVLGASGSVGSGPQVDALAAAAIPAPSVRAGCDASQTFHLDCELGSLTGPLTAH